MDIPGIKGLRLLEQQPVALLPRGVDVSSERVCFIEVTFDSGAIMNVPISKNIHDTFLQRLKEQGTTVEQRVSARGSVALPGILGVATKETLLPVGRPLAPGEVETALREAAAAEDTPASSPTVPAAPLALRAGDVGRMM